ncbi:MAG: hypothetical protein P8R42_01540 [Candidatus Binatia bacterium]|nr:hypothetical protein [Candidatus Binatia bacterium]
MGSRLPDEDTDLRAEYGKDVEELQRCCEDHDAPGCIVEPITNNKEWPARQMAAHP